VIRSFNREHRYGQILLLFPVSTCLLDPVSKVLFVGDLLRYEGEKLPGPPLRFTPVMDEAERSIRRIAMPDFAILLTGHGIPLTSRAAEKVRAFAKTLS
jgi:glyoxylase-like metal-dependent hydrolase (beta-lactamase superfamily II)